MRRSLAFALLLCFAMPFCAMGAAAEKTGLARDVLVLFTSDVHCGVDQNFGYAGLQAVRDTAAQEDYVLLVDDGDSIQGEPIGILTRGQANIELMNKMGYDVAIPGNHEFDYGMDRFFELAEMADFTYVSCNFAKNGELVFPAYVIKEFDGVKIAFVGITTPETLTSSTPRYFQDEDGNYIYSFSQGGDGSMLYEKVQKAVDDARAEGADYVFAISHLGNEAACAPYTYADVLGNTSGIDAMLDGHSHDTMKVVMLNKSGENVIRQACGTKMAGIGWLRISAADGSVDTGLYTWNNSVSAPDLLGLDNEMDRLVDEATGSIRSQLEESVGVSNVELTINDPTAVDESGTPVRIVRRAETNLGDLCADAFRDQMGAEVGIVTGGSIRKSIDVGDITVNEILGVFPFGNRVGVIEATGQQLLDMLEYGVSAVPSENGAFPHVSGMSYEIDMSVPSSVKRDKNGLYTGIEGEYRIKNVMVGGEPLDLEKTYTIAAQSYVLVDHGDGITAFDGCKLLKESEELDYRLIIAHIRDTLGGVVGEGYENPYGQERAVAIGQDE
ncbi:MAG: bifunctional metallophosphatase/5'-nucleotidase [Clostridia bacterium]|nr:bifunctional metallophosphatase/5'-nucleotidase [Clostridia bacterium]